MEVAREIEDARSKASALRTIVSIQRTVAANLVRAGKFKQAVEVAQKIEDASSKIIALRDIASAQKTVATKLARAGQFKQAVEVAQKIEDARSKAFALMDIASAQAKAGDKKQALATLKQALEVAQKIEDVISLTIIASKLARAGEINLAVEFAQKFEDARRKELSLWMITMTLATEPIPEIKMDTHYRLGRLVVRRMKKTFTPKEKQLAKQLVEAIQGN